MSDETKKQRVIHTRVSESLDEEIRKRAEGLGVSVSNLIRNVLSHSFGLVEDVIVDGAKVARSARGERVDDDAPAQSGQLLGWQPILPVRNALCPRCNAILARGTTAYVPFYEGGTGPVELICPSCAAEPDHDSSGD